MTTLITTILSVFTQVVEWITGAVNAVVPMFYSAETGLTLIGTMSIITVAFGVCFLIVGLIQRFMGFRS